MTEDLLAKAERVLAARTKGKWHCDPDDPGCQTDVTLDEGDGFGQSIAVVDAHRNAQAIALLGSVADNLIAVARAAKALMDWDTGDAMNERDRADRNLRGALTALNAALERHFAGGGK